jgi:DNA-binding transcriptional LysR family regulator
VRLKRGVQLSPGGRAALEHATRILEEAEALRERLQGDGRTATGRVRAAAATQAFVHLFAGLFESFMRAHPGIELTFRTTVSTEQTVADILESAAEVGFAALPVYSPSLQVKELFEDELVLVVAPGHRFAGRDSVAVLDVADERLVLFERGSSIRRATDAFFHHVGVRPAMALESNDTYFVKLMVERGLGVSLLPAWAVREEIAAGRLVRLAIEGHRLRRAVSMIFRGRFPAAATRAFVEFMLAHQAELQALARA